MTNGTIKFFNAAKGFGFITPEDGGKDVFVPGASVTASGLPGLKPGQRVSFETEPDAKGPKAVQLKLLAEAPKPVKEIPPPMGNPPPPVREAARPNITVFFDPALEESDIVLDALRDAGQEPRLVDYIATPPSREDLKHLSLLMRGTNQSLVRKYDSLFLELRLDDRFISDSEFWSGIVEHPTLINGPVLVAAHKAAVCRSENAVRSFLGLAPLEEARTAAKPRKIAQSAAVTGDATPALPEEKVQKAEKKLPEKLGQKSEPKTPPKTRAAIAEKPKATVPAKAPVKMKAKPEAKTKAKSEAKPKAKKVAKAVKKPAPKPAKKAKAKK